MTMARLVVGFAFLAMGRLCAQQAVTVHDLVVTAPYPDYEIGADGVNIDLALYFAEYMEDPEDRLYRLDFDLKTPDGDVVYSSRRKPSVVVRAVQPMYASTKAGMVASGDVQVNVPESLQYRMTISELEVKAGQGYDVPIISAHHALPDLQSFLKTGKDFLLVGKITPHS